MLANTAPSSTENLQETNPHSKIIYTKELKSDIKITPSKVFVNFWREEREIIRNHINDEIFDQNWSLSSSSSKD